MIFAGGAPLQWRDLPLLSTKTRDWSRAPPAMNGPEIERLIQLLGRLPGLGPRSARRAALHLLKKRETLMQPLGAALADAARAIRACSTARPRTAF